MRPLVDFLVGGLSGMATVTIVAIAIVAVVFAVLAYVLIMRRDVAPSLQVGRLKIEFKRLAAPRRRSR